MIYTLNIVNQGPDTIYPKDSISYRAVHDYNFSKTIVNRAIGITVVPGDSFQINDSISINTGVTDSVLLSFQPPIVAFGPNEGKGMLTAEFEETRNDNSPRFKFFNIGKAAVSKSNAKNNRNSDDHKYQMDHARYAGEVASKARKKTSSFVVC